MAYDENMALAEARIMLAEQVAADDRETNCPCCRKRVRNDRKGITQWMAMALQVFGKHFLEHSAGSVHAASLLAGTDAARDHGFALLRHWGMVKEEPRPDDADPSLKGSRGLSGWYSLTDEGWDVLEGKKFHKDIVKNFGSDTWSLSGPMVSLSDALDARLNVTSGNVVKDGTTSIPGEED